MDSGATNHMTSSLNLLSDHTLLPPPQYVHLPNGDRTAITQTDTSTLSMSQSVHNVFYIPDFQCNLFAVSKITRDLQCSVSLYPYFYLFQDLWSGLVKGVGRLHGRLYILNPSTPATTSHHCLSSVSTPLQYTLHQHLIFHYQHMFLHL